MPPKVLITARGLDAGIDVDGVGAEPPMMLILETAAGRGGEDFSVGVGPVSAVGLEIDGEAVGGGGAAGECERRRKALRRWFGSTKALTVPREWCCRWCRGRVCRGAGRAE